MTKGCPRTGRSPLRRKKTYIYGALACGALLLLVQMTQYEEGWTPLRPLLDIRQESRRLLQFLNHPHYSCNYTLPINNQTHWPLCFQQDGLFDVDSWEPKLAYSIGFAYDDTVSRDLAANHSYTVYMVSHKPIPKDTAHFNNTHAIHSTIVPNDPADFSRNLYGQQTLNDLMSTLSHDRVSLLRLGSLGTHINMWEILHYAIQDHLLVGIQQLHLVLKVDKLDEDVLFSWYRVLWQLFYEAGLLLYHTTASDSLCMQVTVMESCVYYLSFIHNPGLRFAVTHPPADYGTIEEEQARLISQLTRPQTECSPQIEVGGTDKRLQYSQRGHPQWLLCSVSRQEIFTPPCVIFRFRLDNDPMLEEQFLKEGCSVMSFQLLSLQPDHVHGYQYKFHRRVPGQARDQKKIIQQEEQTLALLWEAASVALLEVDMPGHEWTFLGHLMDGALLRNVSQLVMYTQLPDSSNIARQDKSSQASKLRVLYSDLWRVQAQGMQLQASSHAPPSAVSVSAMFLQECCYHLSFVRRHELLTK